MLTRPSACPAALRVIVSPSDHDLGFHVADDLKAHGLAVTTARVARWNWLRNAAGLADLNYWRGTLQPRPTVDWCAAASRRRRGRQGRDGTKLSVPCARLLHNGLRQSLPNLIGTHNSTRSVTHLPVLPGGCLLPVFVGHQPRRRQAVISPGR